MVLIWDSKISPNIAKNIKLCYNKYMKTNIPSFWKQQVSMPVAAMVMAVSVVTTLAVFETQTGLPASVRSNPVYGSLPVHTAAPTPVIRRAASTSSISSRSTNALRRLRKRVINHKAASASFKTR